MVILALGKMILMMVMEIVFSMVNKFQSMFAFFLKRQGLLRKLVNFNICQSVCLFVCLFLVCLFVCLFVKSKSKLAQMEKLTDHCHCRRYCQL